MLIFLGILQAYVVRHYMGATAGTHALYPGNLYVDLYAASILAIESPFILQYCVWHFPVTEITADEAR